MQDAAKLLRSYWYVWEGSCALVLVVLAGLSLIPSFASQSLRLVAWWLSIVMFLASPWVILFAAVQLPVLQWLEHSGRTTLGSWVLSTACGLLPLVASFLAAASHWRVPPQNYWCAVIVLGATLLSGFMQTRTWKPDTPVYYSRGAGAVVGSALGWSIGFYGPFVYRAILHIPGGNLSGLAEILFWGLPFSVLGFFIGAFYVHLKQD